MTAPAVSTHEFTQLLIEWSEGDQGALERLMPLVYKELRRMAHHYMRREQRGHSLQTTDLVHEAYLKLVDQHRVHWQNRAHFYGIAAQIMRRVLVDRARRRRRAKRGGGAAMVSLTGVAAVSPQAVTDVLEIDEALTKLAEIDPRKAQIVELRFFGGLEVDETAAFLKISPITVQRDWKMAKAWLHRELSNEDN